MRLFNKERRTQKLENLSQRNRLKEIQERYQDARNAAKAERVDWADWRDFFSGEKQKAQYVAPGLSKNPDAELSKDFVVSNFVKSSIRTYEATLLQMVPAWYVAAADMEQDESARKATAYLQAYARSVNLAAQLQMAYEDALVVGTGALKTYYDKGAGDVRVRAIDPKTIIPDPTAHSLEQAEFVALRNVYGVGYAERLWPDIDLEKAQEVTQGDEDAVDQTQSTAKRVEVIEFYYDFGEKLIVYSGQDILYEGDSTMPGGTYPIFLFQMPKRVTDFWPTGLLPDMMDLQNLINRTRSRIAIHERYSANPVWVCDDPAISENVDVSPGNIVRLKTPGSKLEPLTPPPLPPDLRHTIELAQQALDNLSGVHDVMRGIRPVGVTAGIAIEGLQQTAQIRMTGPARAWNYVLADVGEAVLRLMQKHYSDDRSLPTLEGSDLDRVEITADDLSQTVLTSELEETGQLDAEGRPETRAKSEVEPHTYHVVTQPGGDLPLSPAALAELAIQLKQLESIDDQALLDAVKFPGRDKLLERRAGEMAAEQEGMAAGMQARQGEEQQAAGQEQMAAIEAQLSQIAQHLSEMLSPEQMQLLQEIAQGGVDAELAEEFFASLPPQEEQLARQFVQLAMMLTAQAEPELQMA